MPTHRFNLLAVACLILGGLAECNQALRKDVLIIGAGASGAHAAVRLRDMGKDVVVIEKEDVIGGPVGTYTDPATGIAINHGVQIFLDYGNATGLFSRFGVPVAAPNLTAWSPVTKYYDFTNGQAVSNYSMGANETAFAAVATYARICAQYENLLIPGFWNFPTNSSTIPPDLLLPFGTFAAKHNLEPILPWLWSTTANGVTDLLNELTIWVMLAFGGPMARFLLGQQAALVPSSGRNADLYDAVADFLGDDILYSTIVARVKRTQQGVVATVRSSRTGRPTTIHARHLLVAVPPLGGNLDGFDLDVEDEGSTSTSARALAEGNVRDLLRLGVLTEQNGSSTGGSSGGELEWVAFRDHGPMHSGVSAQELKGGWMQKLYSLQGRRSTWYTGAAWASPFQTELWAFNELLLPKMLEE